MGTKWWLTERWTDRWFDNWKNRHIYRRVSLRHTGRRTQTERDRRVKACKRLFIGFITIKLCCCVMTTIKSAFREFSLYLINIWLDLFCVYLRRITGDTEVNWKPKSAVLQPRIADFGFQLTCWAVLPVIQCDPALNRSLLLPVHTYENVVTAVFSLRFSNCPDSLCFVRKVSQYWLFD